jgi:hypothetical protein
MPKKPTFDELIDEALAAPFEGWDFSWLDGRMTQLQLPWDYATRVKARMRGTRAMLDMGTCISTLRNMVASQSGTSGFWLRR